MHRLAPLSLLLLLAPSLVQAQPVTVFWSPPTPEPYDCNADGVSDVDQASGMSPDFDCDGRADLVVRSAGENEVHVLHGTTSGAFNDREVWRQDRADVFGYLEHQTTNWWNPPRADQLGASTAVGDFDCDGFPDLAVGDPRDITGYYGSTDPTDLSEQGQGSVLWMRGGADGLSSDIEDRIIRWDTGGGGMIGQKFGAALASADFNGDGCSDLAIGAPGEARLVVVYGHPLGLTDGVASPWGWPGEILPGGDIGWTSPLDDELGGTLAAGDFNGDGFADLAVGIPGATVNGHDDAGEVLIYEGDGARLWSSGPRFDQADLATLAEPGDRFGDTLAVGDFDGDGYDDLAVGTPHENFGSRVDVGLAHVVFGSAGSVLTGSAVMLNQNVAGITSYGEAGDRFGASLAAGDFDGDGHDDLAIGVPDEGWYVADAGIVHIVPGSDSGMNTTASQVLIRNNDGRVGAVTNDHFGAALAVADYDGDGVPDLAAGAPGSAARYGGDVHVYEGRLTTGLPALADTIVRDHRTGVTCLISDCGWTPGGFGASL